MSRPDTSAGVSVWMASSLISIDCFRHSLGLLALEQKRRFANQNTQACKLSRILQKPNRHRGSLSTCCFKTTNCIEPIAQENAHSEWCHCHIMHALYSLLAVLLVTSASAQIKLQQVDRKVSLSFTCFQYLQWPLLSRERSTKGVRLER